MTNRLTPARGKRRRRQFSVTHLAVADDFGGGDEMSIAARRQWRSRLIGKRVLATGGDGIGLHMIDGAAGVVVTRLALILPQPGMTDQYADIAQRVARIVYQLRRDLAFLADLDVANRNQLRRLLTGNQGDGGRGRWRRCGSGTSARQHAQRGCQRNAQLPHGLPFPTLHVQRGSGRSPVCRRLTPAWSSAISCDSPRRLQRLQSSRTNE